jgi:hypothetical protein
MIEDCSMCRFFHPRTLGDGECRKNAPVTGRGFPMVPVDGWCGQFIER